LGVQVKVGVPVEGAIAHDACAYWVLPVPNAPALNVYPLPVAVIPVTVVAAEPHATRTKSPDVTEIDGLVMEATAVEDVVAT
jgi:hypothetical protein